MAGIVDLVRGASSGASRIEQLVLPHLAELGAATSAIDDVGGKKLISIFGTTTERDLAKVVLRDVIDRSPSLYSVHGGVQDALTAPSLIDDPFAITNFVKRMSIVHDARVDKDILRIMPRTHNDASTLSMMLRERVGGSQQFRVSIDGIRGEPTTRDRILGQHGSTGDQLRSAWSALTGKK
jgi:hypothetical protein